MFVPPPRGWRRLPGAGFYQPSPGDLIEDERLKVKGWAMLDTEPPARVEIMLDDRPVTGARVGDLTFDVEIATGVERARLAGFHATVDLRSLPPERSTVRLGGLAVGFDGSRVEIPPVDLKLRLPPRERLDLARPRHVPPRPVVKPTPGPLRLLVATHRLDFGGGQLFLLELLRRMVEQMDLTGTVLAPSDGPVRSRLEALGFDVHVTGPPLLQDPDAFECRVEELVAWTRAREFDRALINTMLAHPIGVVAFEAGLPAVWAVHESYDLDGYWSTHEPPADPEIRRRAERALSAAQAIVFEADATRELYAPDLPHTPLLTLPYGIDVDALDEWHAGFDRAAARRAAGIPQDAFVVLCLATMEVRKGQVPLVHAFSHVLDAHPDVVLALVGKGDDPYAGAVDVAIDTYGVEDRVRVEPVLPDVRPWYAMADLMVSASDVESLPRSVLEAMALQLPVLAVDVFGVKELISDDETGWLCEPRNTAALAAGLERALSAPEAQRAAIVDAARSMVDRHHRSDVCARAWTRVLLEGEAEPVAAHGHG